MARRKNSLFAVKNRRIPLHVFQLLPLLRFFVFGQGPKRELLLQYLTAQTGLFKTFLEVFYNVFWGYFPISEADKRGLERCRVVFDTLLNKRSSLASKKRFILAHSSSLRRCLKTVLKYAE